MHNMRVKGLDKMVDELHLVGADDAQQGSVGRVRLHVCNDILQQRSVHGMHRCRPVDLAAVEAAAPKAIAPAPIPADGVRHSVQHTQLHAALWSSIPSIIWKGSASLMVNIFIFASCNRHKPPHTAVLHGISPFTR